MELKYVGDLPQVSKTGVTFDHSRPDKYTYLTATVELLEALSYGETETTKHLYTSKHKELNASEILDLLKKFCPDLNKVFETKDDKAKEFVDDLKQRVKENTTLTDAGRETWSRNIDLMTDYYLQYVTNKSAYECAVSALGEEIKSAKVQSLDVPLFRNYGFVLNDLKNSLMLKKAPIDSDIQINQTEKGLLATMTFMHSK